MTVNYNQTLPAPSFHLTIILNHRWVLLPELLCSTVSRTFWCINSNQSKKIIFSCNNKFCKINFVGGHEYCNSSCGLLMLVVTSILQFYIPYCRFTFISFGLFLFFFSVTALFFFVIPIISFHSTMNLLLFFLEESLLKGLYCHKCGHTHFPLLLLFLSLALV